MPTDKPNIVLIMSDQQMYRVIEANSGIEGLNTPNLDRLASDGIRFTKGYSTNPVCSPARACIFTGHYASYAGSFTNNVGMSREIVHMGQRFRDAGYETAYIGKWHLDGHDYFGTGECPNGWNDEYWYDARRYINEIGEEGLKNWRPGLSVNGLRKNNITAEDTWAYRNTERALTFLNSEHEKPYLLVVSFDEPHHPHMCPPEYAEQFEEFDFPLGPSAFDTGENKPYFHSRRMREVPESSARRFPIYFGCNSFMDHEIGRIMESIPDDACIFYTSDHGEMMGEHRMGGKNIMYEASLHIPFIMRLPGRKKAGSVLNTPVSHADILPTMLDLADIEVPPAMPGESLVADLENPKDRERSVVAEFTRCANSLNHEFELVPMRCLVNNRYKLIVNLMDTDELYDLDTDPHEMDNRINDPALSEMRDNMHDKLMTWMYENRDPWRGHYWEARPWRKGNPYDRSWITGWTDKKSDGYAPPFCMYYSGRPKAAP